MPKELTLYTRAGCHLCEEMKAALAPLLREFKVPLREVDVDSDADLATRFGEEVPVLFLGERKVAKVRLDARQLRRRLEGESRRRAAEDAVKAQRSR
jgi:glutaredoxin